MKNSIICIYLVLTTMIAHAQNNDVLEVQNKHKQLLTREFRWLNQPLYCEQFDSMSPKDIDDTQYNSAGLLIVCWATQNRESVEEYKRILNNKKIFDDQNILIVAVSFDYNKDIWKRTIQKEQLHNKWNCFFDMDILKEYEFMDSLLLRHYRNVSLPFGIFVNSEGIIIGAQKNVKFSEAADSNITRISDEEAKYVYQDAEELYEGKNYDAAVKKLSDLYEKMGEWTPRTLYLYLKSVYNCYISNCAFEKNYENYLIVSQACATFFEIIDKTSYPYEKYEEVNRIREYFKQKVEDFAYQKSRTPQSAVDFLNECAAKFRVEKRAIGSSSSLDIKFFLDSVFLRIEYTWDGLSGNYKFYNYSIGVYVIDMSQITNIVKRKTGHTYNYYLTGYTTFESGTKKLQGIVYKRNSISTKKYNEYSDAKRKSVEFIPSSLAIQNWSKYLTVFTSTDEKEVAGFNYMQFFDRDSKSIEFVEGNYETRIYDAFKYLIDHFPKKDKGKNDDRNKTGF